MRFLRFAGGGALSEDPRGLQVRVIVGERVLLGDVSGAYRDEGTGLSMLRVRHFNGEEWPFNPFATQVEVLDREEECDPPHGA
jgi:hypothetical protein